MAKFYKIISVFTNLAIYLSGFAVLIIHILQKRFFAVIVIKSFTFDESLFFNMASFCAGAAALTAVTSLLFEEKEGKKIIAPFPLFWIIIPSALSAAFIYFGITAQTPREKIIVIISAILYFVCSFIAVNFGNKSFSLEQ